MIDLLPALPVLDDCWNRIGVKGDGTCPQLAEVVHCHNCPVFAAAGQQLFEHEPPPGYLQEWTERLARPEPAGQAQATGVILFRIGEEWLSLDIRLLVEVAECRTVHSVPHRSGGGALAGLVNIRGELQLCVSLRELLGIDAGLAANGRLMVVESDRVRWVLSVDEVHGLHHVAATELTNVPSTVAGSRTSFTKAVFHWSGKQIGYLDDARLFAALKERIG